MAITVSRTVRYWTFPPKETVLILDALTSHPGTSLRITPYEKDGEPQILWAVVSDQGIVAPPPSSADGGDPPGGNNSTVCPPIC